LAQTPEKKVKVKTASQLTKLGAYFFFPATGGFGKSGVPDIIGCYLGRFFGIECKAGKGKATALQMHHLKQIRAAGGIALLIDETSVDRVTEYLLAATSNIGEE
jgi:penicillin-binding protein-related factor A (putative recombinase)